MPTDHILSLLVSERDRLTRAIEVLQGTPRRGGRPRKSATPTADSARATNHTRKRPRWNAAQRRAASERSKSMWAANRRKKTAKKG
jgi:hypothetical protein